MYAIFFSFLVKGFRIEIIHDIDSFEFSTRLTLWENPKKPLARAQLETWFTANVY
jgi:hypothetical protein